MRGVAQYKLSRFRLKCSQQTSRVKYLNQLNVAEPKYLSKKSVVMGYAPGSTILPCVTVFIIVQNSIFEGTLNVYDCIKLEIQQRGSVSGSPSDLSGLYGNSYRCFVFSSIEADISRKRSLLLQDSLQRSDTQVYFFKDSCGMSSELLQGFFT